MDKDWNSNEAKLQYFLLKIAQSQVNYREL